MAEERAAVEWVTGIWVAVERGAGEREAGEREAVVDLTGVGLRDGDG